VPEAPLARLEEARILSQQRGQDSARHEAFDRAVREGCSVALSVTRSSLSITGLAVFGLAYASKKGVPRVLHVVERRSGHHLEFLSGRERRNLSGLQRQKVWQGKEKPILRCAGAFFLAVLVLILFTLVCGLRLLRWTRIGRSLWLSGGRLLCNSGNRK